MPVIADVTRDEDCARAVATALERFGRLDILVNNAGRGMKYVSEDFMTEPTRFWETAPDAWRLVIDTNVVGPFLMARAAVPAMFAAGWGRIINISMNADTMRRRGFSPYGPSKAALESDTIIWSQDLAGFRYHRQRAAARRRNGDRNDPVKLSRSSREQAARSVDHGAAAPMAGEHEVRRGHRQRIIAAKWREDLPEAAAAAGW